MGYQRRVHGRTIRNSSIMKTAALAPLLLMFVLSVLHQETAAVCSGCGCNIFCCNCDSACGQDTSCETGCCVDGMSPEDSVDNCCSEKIVGNITYTLLPGLPDIEIHPKTAKDGCIYTVKGEPSGHRYAFEPGHLPVECKEENPNGINSVTPTTTLTATPTTTSISFGKEGIMCAGYKTVVIIDPTTTPHKELALELFYSSTLTRSQHTVNVIDDMFVICGGSELQTRKSCIFYSPILHSWEHFRNFTHDRINHYSFVGQDENKEDAIVLIGNSYSVENDGFDTIEVVQKDSNTLLPTRLPEELAMNGFRDAGCVIQDGKTGILTGGINARKNKATLFRLKGKIPDTVDIYFEDLPSFNTGRTDHACGKYINGLGQTVLLIAGGKTSGTVNGVQLYSTETLVYGEETQWTLHENTISEILNWHGTNLPLVNNKLYIMLNQKMFVWNDETKMWNNTVTLLEDYHDAESRCAVIPHYEIFAT